MSISKRGVTVHDIRSAKTYLVRVEDKRDGHRWVLVVEPETPIEARFDDRDGTKTAIRFFAAASRDGAPVALLPQKGSALGEILEEWAEKRRKSATPKPAQEAMSSEKEEEFPDFNQLDQLEEANLT